MMKSRFFILGVMLILALPVHTPMAAEDEIIEWKSMDEEEVL